MSKLYVEGPGQFSLWHGPHLGTAHRNPLELLRGFSQLLALISAPHALSTVAYVIHHSFLRSFGKLLQDWGGEPRSLPPRSHVCGVDKRLRAQRLTAWIQILPLPLPHCVASGEAYHLSELQLPLLWNGTRPCPQSHIRGTAAPPHLALLHPLLQLLLLLLQRLHLGGRGHVAVTAGATPQALTAA